MLIIIEYFYLIILYFIMVFKILFEGIGRLIIYLFDLFYN